MSNNEKVSNKGNNLAYLAAGGAIGVGLGLLFAPKSGKETRRDISDVTLKGVDKAKDLSADVSQSATDLSQKAKDVYNQTQEKAVEIYQTAKDGINSQIESAKENFASTANDVKALPEKAENFVADKLENVADQAQDFAKSSDSQAKKMRG